ncbi:DNA-directed RNA polymerase, alpha subunit [Babesia caballi]|uniref:DNA-directed RNA polymerase, alpha subunit n=1 Tax=Babesia caballi TaxID=5871 RepID=A0AAV4M1N0_BABCB|nr:DNA-directed RNA polymerase, alpha subunit [Babesia caballi]
MSRSGRWTGRFLTRALNPEQAELHPESLSGVDPAIGEDRIDELRRKGVIEGDSRTWRNWHVVTQGQWDDVGEQLMPKSEPNPAITEPYALRKPLKYWGFMRGVRHAGHKHHVVPDRLGVLQRHVWKGRRGGGRRKQPAVYALDVPAHVGHGGGPRGARVQRLPPVRRVDRAGPRCADEGEDGERSDFDPRHGYASLSVVPTSAGRLYQKFYLGPYPITMGWTIGSLLKVLALSRSPGHGVVAVKVHNMREDTTIPGVTDDLLNIALNLNEVALETLKPGEEARVRTLIKGPATVCAGSLQWPSFVKIASPDTYIARVEEGGELDIEVKIEWGRGLWLADSTGLYRQEEGADAICMKRRRVKEVDEEGFHPLTTFFSGCRMVRLAVHKLLGQRWDILSDACPDPREQLVVEVWTDRSTTPKAALEFGLRESLAWLRELRRQLSQDADFDGEDEQLRDTWEKIDKYQSLERRQAMMGGPPAFNLHETDAFPGLKAADCQYVGSPDDVKLMPQAPYSLPNFSPPPPAQDSLEWLAEELQSEEYADKSAITAKNFERFLAQPEDAARAVDLSVLPVSPAVVVALRMCGLNSVGDVAGLSAEELERYPEVSAEDAGRIVEFVKANFNLEK